jgi:hypothetical protein
MAEAHAKAAQAAELADLKLGKPIAIHLAGESQAPFVTSVSPVVGRNDDPFGQLPSNRRKLRSPEALDGPAVAAAHLDARVLVAAIDDAKGGEADGKDKEGDVDASFGLGKIQFTAHVSVEYELLE